MKSGKKVSRIAAFGCIALTAVLGACAGLREPLSNWPPELPAANYFVSTYEQDSLLDEYQSLDEYLYWVRSFYKGTALYPHGWSDISEDILAATEDADRSLERERRLATLGRDIAAEWAKANEIRRVDNRHLAVWSEAARRSVGEDNVDETFTKISEDLDQLLSEALDPEAITADRYHAPDPDDWFAL